MQSYTVKGYTIRATAYDRQPGTWHGLHCEIFRGDQRLGEYDRNYPNLMRTFYPFEKGGKEYALYSPNYTASRVMRLPECEDIGGEEPGGGGFCPVDFYVPVVLTRDSESGHDNQGHRYFRYTGDEYDIARGAFGFVAGCVWGDDSSWKIQYLDLSDVEQGVIRRDDRFGYLELPDNLSMEQGVGVRREPYHSDHWNGFSVQLTTSAVFHQDGRLLATPQFIAEQFPGDEDGSSPLVRLEGKLLDRLHKKLGAFELQGSESHRREDRIRVQDYINELIRQDLGESPE